MTAPQKTGATRERGRKRRDLLLNAARSLLKTAESDSITLADVALHAAIPKSSAYHFYTDIVDLYDELVVLLDEELQLRIAPPLPEVADWEAAFGVTIDRAAAFFEEVPEAQRLMLASQAPPAVKRLSRRADIETGAIIMALIDAQFVLPDIPDRDRIFFRAVEAADLLFGLSLFESGALQPEMVEEGKKMACAYLALYLPRHLPRR